MLTPDAHNRHRVFALRNSDNDRIAASELRRPRRSDPAVAELVLVHGPSCICHICRQRLGVDRIAA